MMRLILDPSSIGFGSEVYPHRRIAAVEGPSGIPDSRRLDPLPPTAIRRMLRGAADAAPPQSRSFRSPLERPAAAPRVAPPPPTGSAATRASAAGTSSTRRA